MNIKKMIGGTAAGVAIFGSFAVAVFAATTISNGSFETGIDPGVFATLTAGDNTSITDWTVNSGSIDYIGTYWTAADGAKSLDMNGLAAGSITQTLATVVGAKYDVTFSLSGNPASSSEPTLTSPNIKVLSVSATGTAPQLYSYDTGLKGNSLSDMKWESNSYSFVATGPSTTLTFASQIPGAFGPALDKVMITEVMPKDQCKNNGWKTMDDGHGHKFKNQGDCVSFFATKGKNVGAVTQ